MADVDIEKAWDICDDGWQFSFRCDQWWSLVASCPHGRYQVTSSGSGDFDQAMERLIAKIQAEHPLG